MYLSQQKILNSPVPSRKKSALHERGRACIIASLYVNLPQAQDVPWEPHDLSSPQPEVSRGTL